MSVLRLRSLTEADRAVWRAYVERGIRPLSRCAVPPDAVPLSSSSASSVPAPTAPALPPAPKAMVPREKTVSPPPPPLMIGERSAGLDERRWRALLRGRIRPERLLDLHGRRAGEAHALVRRFLAAADAEGLRCVAIVTGRGAAAEGGVLRRELPHWLNAPDVRPMILAAGHPPPGNIGAVYILLRRRR